MISGKLHIHMHLFFDSVQSHFEYFRMKNYLQNTILSLHNKAVAQHCQKNQLILKSVIFYIRTYFDSCKFLCTVFPKHVDYFWPFDLCKWIIKWVSMVFTWKIYYYHKKGESLGVPNADAFVPCHIFQSTELFQVVILRVGKCQV